MTSMLTLHTSPVGRQGGEMNTTGQQDNRLSLERWNEPEMKRALADRDISSVYRLLRRVGISQRHIAALTAQSQSEISEILKGRQVMAYEVLGRIADGLGIPRGYMGLAYDASSARLAGTAVSNHYGDSDEDEQVRRMLAHAAQVTIGVATGDSEEWAEPLAPVETPAPHRIGMADVEQVETVTRTLRALDYKHGGG